MSRFSKINLKEMLNDFEAQTIDWEILGDVVGDVDASIEKDVFDKFEKGEYLHAVIRFDTYVTNTVIKILYEKGMIKLEFKNVKKLQGVGWIMETHGKNKYLKYNVILKQLKKLIKKQHKTTWPNLPPYLTDLIGDIMLVNKMRNNYAHRLAPFDIFAKRNHDEILKGMKNVWSDLKIFYNSCGIA